MRKMVAMTEALIQSMNKLPKVKEVKNNNLPKTEDSDNLVH